MFSSLLVAAAEWGLPLRLGQLGVGAVIGEVGCLTHQPRSATVVALGTALVLRIPGAAHDLTWSLVESCRATRRTVAQGRREPHRNKGQPLKLRAGSCEILE